MHIFLTSLIGYTTTCQIHTIYSKMYLFMKSKSYLLDFHQMSSLYHRLYNHQFVECHHQKMLCSSTLESVTCLCIALHNLNDSSLALIIWLASVLAAVAMAMSDFYDTLRRRLRSPEQGADTVIWLAVSPAATRTPSGKFFQGGSGHAIS